jgi:hypothetical protein
LAASAAIANDSTAYDRKMYGNGKVSNPDIIAMQSWLSYALKSGANWKGPIKNFRMVVDKGKPGNLVSLCISGVKKISPTQFEIVRTNFEPTGDVDVLFVEFIDNGAAPP